MILPEHYIERKRSRTVDMGDRNRRYCGDCVNRRAQAFAIRSYQPKTLVCRSAQIPSDCFNAYTLMRAAQILVAVG